MPAIHDLSPCDYLPVPSEALLAVGWLSIDSTYERGEVAKEFFNKLQTLCFQPWQPVASAGRHACQLCQFEAPSFSANIFVPYGGAIYVAPVAIVHYIAAHWYKPPNVFIEAVMNCPPMSSMDYKKLILANGGRSLLKATIG